MSDPKKHFWQEGLSIKESKFSVLVLLLIFCVGIALRSYVFIGEIGHNLVEIIRVLVYAVAGVNVAESFGRAFRKDKKEEGGTI